MWVDCVVLLLLFGGFPFVVGLRPVVLWHGLGDYCCSEEGVGAYVNLIKEEITGIYVLSLRIGKNVDEDAYNSIHKNLEKQVSTACEIIKEDVKLQNGYNAVGFSQGALLLRAVVQKCPEPKMFNLVSLGGPHQGIFGIAGIEHSRILNKIARHTNIPKWDLLKRKYAFLQYWHDPRNEKRYRKKNNFIARLNNEKEINQEYKRNLMHLNCLVLVKFTNDQVMIPASSQWFEYYKPGQAKEIFKLEESRLWLDDRLGLVEMNLQKRLKFLSIQAGHLEIDDNWFINNIIHIYLKE